MKKGSEIVPEENYRLKQEDIYAVQMSKDSTRDTAST
jgi:hypothetical protein